MMTDPHRELGVEFGDLAALLDDHEYPATMQELTDAYGDYEVTYPDGTERLATLLAPYDDTYQSATEVRQAVLNGVGQGAVGRKAYTDRGGFASTRNDVSF
ncbi:hypothetical protein M0R88_09040 [Halorussus gelatinilyticus]|uniref:DUF2795 domain-containing protein n=1 Tax=Halorussus gelatinilyticus TaxID=2937524 RepID=A0A8U0IQ46_9EURY|nr:hypothetical protein [Halorussus gelatinilyticus]UPW02224.1 hypothetical protein M0R88_09040 [Halorussus gelatinilyticus]